MRGVHFSVMAVDQESTSPLTASRKVMLQDVDSQISNTDGGEANAEQSANELSPYQHKVANRRSHSYSREPRSPSWHKANFNSVLSASAMSS